ncbi:MAG: hypothetical protein ACYSUY_07725 [Planctomycetota bacterium]
MLRKTSLNTSLLMSVFLVAMVCSIASGGTIYGAAAAPPTHATNPNPSDGAVDVPVDANLSWVQGEFAIQEEVYFGTDPCDANLPLVDTLQVGVVDPLFDPPGDLVASTTYYWYITEVNGPNEYQGPVWSFSTIPGEAQCDYPEDGAVIPGDPYPPTPSILYTELIYIPGPTAIQHTGYFSKVRDEVANRTEDAKIPIPPFPWYGYKYIVPPYGESLIRGQVYYWTDDETDSFGNVFQGDVWEFAVQDYYAFVPSPPNEAIFIDTDVLLSWFEGYGAQNHDVYFGTNWEDVNNAYFRFPVHESSPEYQGTTDVGVLSWQMSGLDPGTRYYWRIDEVQGRFPPSPGMIYKGDVWSFTTEGGEAQCQYPEDGAVILGDPYPPDPSILYTELVFIPGPTAVKHTGYVSTNRDDVVNRVEDANFGPPPLEAYQGYEYTYFVGNPSFLPYLSLVRGTRYYWTVDETDALGNVYSGGVWEFAVQGYKASLPNPPNEATFVETDVLLCWAPAIDATEYYVYIGTSFDLDPCGPFPLEFLGTTSGTCIQVTGLAFDTKYYWRVDAVSHRFPPGPPTIYRGDVWSFTTTSVDLNNDCSINFKDYAILTKDWMKTGTGFSGDINGDDKVNYNDLRILVRNWLCEICNSNSIVQDDIEYYILTDKFAYNSGEEVWMLYRVTNLASIQVNLGWVPIPPFCYHFVIGDNNGEHVWQWSWEMPPMPPVEFILDAYESKEYEIGWDMINDNGTAETEDDFPVGPGIYNITGELHTSPEEDRVRVSVSVNVRE